MTTTIGRLRETAARAADEAMRSKADALEKLAQELDDRAAKPDGYHANTLAWFTSKPPELREDAAMLRQIGRALLAAALSPRKGGDNG